MSINPMDFARPNVSPSITINPDGSVDLSVIDYDTEKGPFWYVEVDGTPLSPDRPLPLEHAIAEFRRLVAGVTYGETVGIRQCEAEDLEWAGVTPASDEDGEAGCPEHDEENPNYAAADTTT